MIEAVNYAHNHNLDILFCMDSNCHSQVFGSKENNTRGNTFENFIFSYGRVPLNKGNDPTLVRDNCGTIVDVTFCNRRSNNRITDWSVSREKTESDHKLIQFNYIAPKTDIILKRSFKNMDW